MQSKQLISANHGCVEKGGVKRGFFMLMEINEVMLKRFMRCWCKSNALLFCLLARPLLTQSQVNMAKGTCLLLLPKTSFINLAFGQKEKTFSSCTPTFAHTNTYTSTEWEGACMRPSIGVRRITSVSADAPSHILKVFFPTAK